VSILQHLLAKMTESRLNGGLAGTALLYIAYRFRKGDGAREWR
jgi:hypothetical protein